MKTAIKILFFLLVILTTIDSNGQNFIKYEENIYDSESFKLLFIDTVTNKVVDSFYLHERNPYYKLPYDVIEEGGYRRLKTYGFRNIDSLTENDIPGLITYSKEGVSRKPYQANPRHRAYLSSNNQFAVVQNTFEIYLGYDNFNFDYASFIVVYQANGSIKSSFYSKDQFIDYTKITSDGNYCLIYGWMYDSDAPHGSLKQWRIVDVRNNQTLLTVRSDDENFLSGYGKIDGNYICIVQKIRNDSSAYGSKGHGLLRCFNIDSNLVYSTVVEPKNTSFSMFQRVDSVGVHLKIKQGKDEPNQVLRFDRDFTKQPIR